MNIGMEFEFTGVSRFQVYKFLFNYFGNGCTRLGICDDLTCNDRTCFREYALFSFMDMKNREWTLGQDVSVRGEMTNNDVNNRKSLDTSENNHHQYSNELQTPVLNSDDEYDMKVLYDVLIILRSMGCVVNDSCAFHLHIDAPGERELGLYLHKYLQIQDEQYKLFNSECKRKNFAKSYDVPVDCHKLLTLSDIYDYIQSNYPLARYADGKLDAKHFNINFAAVEEHNTVEFRAFNGTLEFDDVIKRVNYIKSFVEECNYLKYHGWFDNLND